jgi:8-oxo-dGTP pyrophosphatase MutT (NUDIX family)
MRELIVSRLRTEAGAPSRQPPPLQGDYDLNPSVERPGPSLTPAAVLVPIVERAEGMTVLLTQRTDHLNDHPGQISFPGGRVEEHDEGPVAAALRETEEEVGLARRHVEVVGALDIYETVTGFSVTPVVGLVEPSFSLALDAFEVAEAFEVPLDFILDPENHERHSRTYNGTERHFYVLPYEERYIWGATAGMLVNLYRKLLA